MAGKCIAEGAESAGRRERLELHTLDVHGFNPLHRRNTLAFPVLEHFAVVQVFVDDALGRPVEGIPHQARWVLGEGTHPQSERATRVELSHQIGADDADVARSQATLGRHQGARRVAELQDGLRRGRILSQIEVVLATRMGGRSDAPVQMVRQAGEQRVVRRRELEPRVRGQVDRLGRERQRLDRWTHIEAGDVEAASVQELGDQGADTAESQHGDSGESHRSISDVEANALRQGECCRIVHRNRLTSHVRPPGVGASLSAAPSILLSPKGTTDFRTGRTDIYVGDAAV